MLRFSEQSAWFNLTYFGEILKSCCAVVESAEETGDSGEALTEHTEHGESLVNLAHATYAAMLQKDGGYPLDKLVNGVWGGGVFGVEA